MRRKFLQLNATTRADRHQMIELGKDTITSSGGWILDFKLFSNVSICINFELPDHNVAAFRDRLVAAEWRLDERSLQALEVFTEPAGQGSAPMDLIGTLQITFVHEEPDLRIPVPMIPG